MTKLVQVQRTRLIAGERARRDAGNLPVGPGRDPHTPARRAQPALVFPPNRRADTAGSRVRHRLCRRSRPALARWTSSRPLSQGKIARLRRSGALRIPRRAARSGTRPPPRIAGSGNPSAVSGAGSAFPHSYVRVTQKVSSRCHTSPGNGRAPVAQRAMDPG